MAPTRSPGQRFISVIVASILLLGGIAGVASSVAIYSRIGSFVAIGAGLVFLGIAAFTRTSNT